MDDIFIIIYLAGCILTSTLVYAGFSSKVNVAEIMSIIILWPIFFIAYFCTYLFIGTKRVFIRFFKGDEKELFDNKELLKD